MSRPMILARNEPFDHLMTREFLLASHESRFHLRGLTKSLEAKRS
jgi:hypothetical protein